MTTLTSTRPPGSSPSTSSTASSNSTGVGAGFGPTKTMNNRYHRSSGYFGSSIVVGSVRGGGSSNEDDLETGEEQEIILHRPKGLDSKSEKVAGSFGFSIRGGIEHGVGHFISEVEMGSESHLAGLKVGDQLISVDGLGVFGATHREIVNLISVKDKMVIRVKSVGVIPVKDKSGDPISWKKTSEFLNKSNNSKKDNKMQPPVYQNVNDLSWIAAKEVRLILNISGQQGLGCSICKGPMAKPGIFVQSTKPEGLARKSGIRPGDQITECNGISFERLDFADAVVHLKASRRLDLVVRKGAGADLFPSESSGYDSSSSNVSAEIHAEDANRNNRNVNVQNVKESGVKKSKSITNLREEIEPDLNNSEVKVVTNRIKWEERLIEEEKKKLEEEHEKLRREAQKLEVEKRRFEEEKRLAASTPVPIPNNSINHAPNEPVQGESTLNKSGLASQIQNELQRRAAARQSGGTLARIQEAKAKINDGNRKLTAPLSKLKNEKHDALMEEFKKAHRRMFKSSENIIEEEEEQEEPQQQVGKVTFSPLEDASLTSCSTCPPSAKVDQSKKSSCSSSDGSEDTDTTNTSFVDNNDNSNKNVHSKTLMSKPTISPPPPPPKKNQIKKSSSHDPMIVTSNIESRTREAFGGSVSSSPCPSSNEAAGNARDGRQSSNSEATSVMTTSTTLYTRKKKISSNSSTSNYYYNRNNSTTRKLSSNSSHFRRSVRGPGIPAPDYDSSPELSSGNKHQHVYETPSRSLRRSSRTFSQQRRSTSRSSERKSYSNKSTLLMSRRHRQSASMSNLYTSVDAEDHYEGVFTKPINASRSVSDLTQAEQGAIDTCTMRKRDTRVTNQPAFAKRHHFPSPGADGGNMENFESFSIHDVVMKPKNHNPKPPPFYFDPDTEYMQQQQNRSNCNTIVRPPLSTAAKSGLVNITSYRDQHEPGRFNFLPSNKQAEIAAQDYRAANNIVSNRLIECNNKTNLANELSQTLARSGLIMRNSTERRSVSTLNNIKVSSSPMNISNSKPATISHKAEVMKRKKPPAPPPPPPLKDRK